MARTLVTAIAAAGVLAAAGAALTVPASAKPTAGEHGEGEGIRVCLQCDENWKNCKEPLASRVPERSTPPISDKAAPEPGQSAAGTPAHRLNRMFKLQRRVE